jgi:hypothetical protein
MGDEGQWNIPNTSACKTVESTPPIASTRRAAGVACTYRHAGDPRPEFRNSAIARVAPIS